MNTYFWNPTLNRSPDFVSMHREYRRYTGNFLLQNFGDVLGKFLLNSELPEQSFVWSIPSKATLFSIGSIAETVLNSNSTRIANLWGTGFKSPDFKQSKKNREFRVLALRGLYSKRNLEISSRYTVLGDPGLLTSLHVTHPPHSLKLSGLVIPHYSFYQSAERVEYLSELQQNGLRIINVGDNLNQIIDQIGSTSIVFSNALHPLIVADSLGIPAVRIVGGLTDNSEFKYADYLSIYPEQISWPKISWESVTRRSFNEQQVVSDSMERLQLIDSRIRNVQDDLREVLHDWSRSLG